MTLLAFVYVPLNLATSIFGMNLQQLNGNGQSVWVFITTAIAALFLTFFVWFIIEQRVGYVRWRRQMSAPANNNDHWPEGKTDHNFVTRIAILIILFRNGHQRWLWKSKTWLRILANEHIGDHFRFTTFNIPQGRAITMCDYVCLNMRQGKL